jgi:hypothetical protein
MHTSPFPPILAPLVKPKAKVYRGKMGWNLPCLFPRCACPVSIKSPFSDLYCYLTLFGMLGQVVHLTCEFQQLGPWAWKYCSTSLHVYWHLDQTSTTTYLAYEGVSQQIFLTWPTWYHQVRPPLTSQRCFKRHLWSQQALLTLAATASCYMKKERLPSLIIPCLMVSCAFDHKVKLYESRNITRFAHHCEHTVGIQLIFV